ncbi:hypothetical protein Tco_1506666 [Tanacetum coccineum]
MHNLFVRKCPWCILGNFNAALNLEDSTAGSSRVDISMREFKECVAEIKVIDVARSGLRDGQVSGFYMFQVVRRLKNLKKPLSKLLYEHAVKSRISRSRIEVVMDTSGTLFANEQVADAFMNHYEAFLGQSVHTGTFDIESLFLNTLDSEVALSMVHPITEIEVKKAIFSIGNDKALGPDGFTAAFFKEAWDIVSKDVIKAV